jgi:putative endonuclease
LKKAKLSEKFLPPKPAGRRCTDVLTSFPQPYLAWMSQHITTGKSGEDLAAMYLEHKGYTVIERNWRSRRNEVDIIASEKKMLHFVEVKTRSNLDFALPESKVKGPKLRHLKEAAETYLYLHPEWKMIQFDILSVIIKADGSANYFMIEDVF